MNRPLRIGIFVMMFPQLSETFIVTKVLKLIDAGFDVHVFSFAESPHWNAFEVLANRADVRRRVHVLPPLKNLPRAVAEGAARVATKAMRHPRAFARYIGHTWNVRNETTFGFLKSLLFRIDFVGHELDILHVEFDYQGVGVVDLKELFGCRLLCSSRGASHISSASDQRPDAYDYLFRHVDGYHFISKFVDRNTHRLGLPADIPTWHIEPAIDLSLFHPQPRRVRSPSDKLRVISVGRLSWSKGHEFALDAIARVRRAGVDVDFTIYGGGDYDEPIRYALHQLQLDGIARLAGPIKREDMPGIYASADVMLHAAIDEGFCNAVIEAQAMQVPVVTSDTGGLPENVEHGVTGFVVPRRDSEALASRIIELAHDPALAHRLGVRGRERALARFDLDRQAEAFVQLYTELAALPRRPVQRRTATIP